MISIRRTRYLRDSAAAQAYFEATDLANSLQAMVDRSLLLLGYIVAQRTHSIAGAPTSAKSLASPNGWPAPANWHTGKGKFGHGFQFRIDDTTEFNLTNN
ncbi:MAG: hypothetical protein AB8B91_22670 [Rubripirellula sp.]